MTGIEPNIQPVQHDPEWAPPPPPEPLPPESALPEPSIPAPPRRPLYRPLSALLCFAASILTLLATFIDLLTTNIDGLGERLVLTVSAWGMQATSNGRPDPTAPDWLIATNGPPLIFAAIVLLVAALLGLFAAASPGSVAIVRASTLTAVAGLAFLAGVGWAVLQEVLTWLDRFQSIFGDSRFRYEIDNTLGLGFWFLAGAVVAAIAGVVLAFMPIRLRLRRATRVEPDTPPFGVPVASGAVVHRLPDAPADEPE